MNGPGVVWIGDWLRAAIALQADAATVQAIGRLLGMAAGPGAVAPAAADGAAGVGDEAPPDEGERLPPPHDHGGHDGHDGNDGDSAAQAPRPPPTADAAAQHWRLPSRIQPLPPADAADTEPGAGPPPGWAGLAPLHPQPLRPRPAAPLLATPRRRAVLSALLAETVADGEPDVDRIVASAALGLPLERLPRLPRRTLRHGAELRIDRAVWLAPFAADADALAAYLKRLLPPARLRLSTVDGSPSERPRPRRRRAAAAPLPKLKHAPVLLLSDLGQGAWARGGPPAPPLDWRRFAAAMSRRGRRVLALTPRPGPTAQASGIALWPWDERLGVAEAARSEPPRRPAARPLAALPHPETAPLQGSAVTLPQAGPASTATLDPDSVLAAAAAAIASADVLAEVAAPVVALAALLCPVLRITPWHLRAARRMLRPALPPAAEADFWFSPLVAQRGIDALVLEPDVRRALIAALAAEAGPVLAAALDLLRRGWSGRGDVALIEEQLLAAELEGRLDEACAGELLAPALKALATPGHRRGGAGAAAARDVAGWSLHAWQRFSPALRRTEAARLLAFAAARHLQPLPAAGSQAVAAAMLADEAGRLPAWPSAGAWATELLGADEAPVVYVSVELRHYADGSINLVIGPPQPPTTALHRIALPLAGPLWLGLRQPLAEAAATSKAAPGASSVAAGARMQRPPLRELVAIDPTGYTQVEVPSSDAESPFELLTAGGSRWRLWQAQSLAEAVRPAFLHHDPGVALLLLDASRALLWPSARPAERERVTRLAELSFSAWNGQTCRVQPIGTLAPRALAPGMAVVQLLAPPAGAVPIDAEATDRPATGVLAEQSHAYLPIPAFEDIAAGGEAVGARLQYSGEGSYHWDGKLPSPGLLLPGYGGYGAMLVQPDDHPRVVVPQPLAGLQREARALAPPLWRALIVALPGREQEAFTLWDHLVSTVGAERCAHDHDGRFLGRAAQRDGVLRSCDLVVVVGHAPPDADAAAAIDEAAQLGKAIGWLPLAAAPLDPSRSAVPPSGLDAAESAALLAGWPPRLARVMRARPPLSRAATIDAAAKDVTAAMQQSRGAAGAAPELGAVAAPMPPPSLASSLRATLLRKLDARGDDEIGLFRVIAPARSGQPLRFEPAAEWPGGADPALLLVHGELSDTEPSFGALWRHDDDSGAPLRARYGDRIYAWRWRSASPGIARNARLLLQALPKQAGDSDHAPAHLLTLGAGGLLVELILAMATASGAQAKEWAGRAWPALPPRRRDELDSAVDTSGNSRPRHGAYDDREAFDGWTAYGFYAGKPKIERFVRVACPAAGTPLLARGADRLLGALRSATGVLPGLGLLRATLPDTLLDDPAAAPGLAGLVPGAGVLPLLTTEVVTDVPLTIVAGALQWRDSVLGWLKSALPRLAGLGPGASDGVVPLASAFGGIERSPGVDWLVTEGPEASHFGYFDVPATRRAIVAALLAPPGQTPPGFAHGDTLAELQRRFAGADARAA
ncbi:MAG: hypothetical protein JNL87_09970 [Burkholderiaceae bacterium]|nr:hypothetical protein [Burkholderiaceae bacterium]